MRQMPVAGVRLVPMVVHNVSLFAQENLSEIPQLTNPV